MLRGPTGSSGGEIVAVGRYDRLPSSQRAEVAFVTAENHRGRGLASQLLIRLAAAAQAVGIDEFVAQTLPENQRMLGVFTRSPFRTVTSFGGGVVHVLMSLTAIDHVALDAKIWR